MTPVSVVEKARTCVLNAFGMGLNGLETPYVKVAREAVLATEGEVANGATLFGDGRRTTIAGACLANSALFHGRDQRSPADESTLTATVSKGINRPLFGRQRQGT